MSALKWNGAAVLERVAEAAALAIDRTMAECVKHAKDNHPSYPPPSEPFERYANRTAFLTNSIRILSEAKLDAPLIKGQWGSEANYALYLEIGTGMEGASAAERAALFGSEGQGATDWKMAPRPYLRPAMDHEYPLLLARVGAAYRGMSMP